MTLLESLKNTAQEKAGNLMVEDIRIGLTYTMCLLDSGSAGLAYTFQRELDGTCCCFQLTQPIAGRMACDIIEYISSDNILERGIGLSAANAVLNRPGQDLIKGDVLKMLETGSQDIVGMIGYFKPLVQQLKGKVKKMYIFENARRQADEKLYPPDKAFELLPSCTTAIITSTAIINQTMEKLLASVKGCKKTALVGASTPLCSQVFEPYGVSILSGLIVTDTVSVLQTVSEGGGMRSFKGFVEKVNSVC